ncbi:hypothetical protein [Actinacidiphila sp. ITFR-21]|nr:hypothetical protein [Streptomyces sp. ITFR-21]WNI16167.1 hypothetical protein RLT57_11905 [Streptomyces sp. ITFR-21]
MRAHITWQPIPGRFMPQIFPQLYSGHLPYVAGMGSRLLIGRTLSG